MERNIAGILLKDNSNTITEITKPEISKTVISFPLEQLTGKYEIQNGVIANISIKNDSLHVLQEWNNFEYNIYNSEGNTYKIPNTNGVDFIFSEVKDQKTQLITIYQNG